LESNPGLKSGFTIRICESLSRRSVFCRPPMKTQSFFRERGSILPSA
jgi:hypothetical protein